MIAYVADQIGATDDLSYSFSSDTARRQRAGILDFLGFRRASDRDRDSIQAWMIEQLGGRDLSLTDWIERGFGQAQRMGVFVPSAKIMERLARAARRDVRETFLMLVASRLSTETAQRLERTLAEPLEDTGFLRLKDDIGAVHGKERLLVEIAMAALDHPDGRIEDVIFPIAGAAKLRAVIDEHRAKGTLDARIQQTMRSSYASHYRRMLPPLLRTLQFRSNNSVWHPILNALDQIARFAASGRRFSRCQL